MNEWVSVHVGSEQEKVSRILEVVLKIMLVTQHFPSAAIHPWRNTFGQRRKGVLFGLYLPRKTKRKRIFCVFYWTNKNTFCQSNPFPLSHTHTSLVRLMTILFFINFLVWITFKHKLMRTTLFAWVF